MHRGRLNIALSERALSTRTRLRNRPSAGKRPDADMRLRHYSHVAGGLIVSNEARPSPPFEVNGYFRPSRF